VPAVRAVTITSDRSSPATTAASTKGLKAEAVKRGSAPVHQRADRRPHVIAVLPRGEALRNFVYSGALDEVAAQADLTVLSVIPSDGIRALLHSRYPSVIPLEADIEELYVIGFLREILDMAHGRWLWSAAAQERWRIRDVEAATEGARLKRLIKKSACYPFASRRGLEVLSRIEGVASRWSSSSDHYLRLLRRLKPTLVFNGSHVHGGPAIPVVHAARRLGIPTAAFIFSWDNLTSQGRIIPPYDFYLVWNTGLRDRLLDMYRNVLPDHVFVTGTPQFDPHFCPETYWSREEFCARVGADPSRPIVVYTTGMANHMPGEPRIVQGIADIVRGMDDLGPPQLLVRVYPKDRTGRFEELKRAYPDILFPEVPWEPAWLTPKIEDTPLLTNTLRHAALGINVGSTISLELCMFDKPVINVAYNPPGLNVEPVDYRRGYEFDHYRPVVESGAVVVAYTEAQMKTLLRRALTHPEERRANRSRLIAAMFEKTLDGWSSTRVAAVLRALGEGGSIGDYSTVASACTPNLRAHTNAEALRGRSH
jgi:hypothetical protein